jgi:phosphate transport system ATP-binding protein
MKATIENETLMREKPMSTENDAPIAQELDLSDLVLTSEETERLDAKGTGESSLIVTHEVGVYYDDVNRALADVSLSFVRGEVSALIGPSGCGKSTFLRCLNLMNREIPHCRVVGDIEYHGSNINTPTQDLFELRQSIGMVFQQPNPFRKSIYENIAFAPRRHGIRGKQKLDELVETSLRNAALWDEVKDKLNKSAWALSGGQQQRLCIARMLALKPDVILMDEPCSALDPISTFAVEETIRALAAQGICIIIVTHNMEQAVRVSDNTAYFFMGDMVESGSTDQLFSHPVDQRTEDYLTGRFG